MLLSVVVLAPSIRSERRFDSQLSIAQLKQKLELITGIAPTAQQIRFQHSGVVPSADDQDQLLGSFVAPTHDPTNPLTINVSDVTRPEGSSADPFSDFDSVPKFELPDEVYDTLKDSVRAFKRVNHFGRFGEATSTSTTKPVESQDEIAQVDDIRVGMRCEVLPPSNASSNSAAAVTATATMNHRGTVRFVGKTAFGDGSGVWVGVEYDEPVGRGDGSVEGTRYFTCTRQGAYAVFVRPERVRVGEEFVVRDEFADDEEMEEI